LTKRSSHTMWKSKTSDTRELEAIRQDLLQRIQLRMAEKAVQQAEADTDLPEPPKHYTRKLERNLNNARPLRAAQSATTRGAPWIREHMKKRSRPVSQASTGVAAGHNDTCSLALEELSPSSAATAGHTSCEREMPALRPQSAPAERPSEHFGSPLMTSFRHNRLPSRADELTRISHSNAPARAEPHDSLSADQPTATSRRVTYQGVSPPGFELTMPACFPPRIQAVINMASRNPRAIGMEEVHSLLKAEMTAELAYELRSAGALDRIFEMLSTSISRGRAGGEEDVQHSILSLLFKVGAVSEGQAAVSTGLMALLHRAQRPQEADARQDSSQAKRGGTRAAAAERKREQATEDSIKQAVDAVCVGSSLWVYPGGRRTRDGKPQLRAFQTYVQMSPLAFLLIAGKKQKVSIRGVLAWESAEFQREYGLDDAEMRCVFRIQGVLRGAQNSAEEAVTLDFRTKSSAERDAWIRGVTAIMSGAQRTDSEAS